MSNRPHILAFSILYFLKFSAVSSYATYRPFLPRVVTTSHLYAPSSSSSLSLSSSPSSDQVPLIDLQTFLKLTKLVNSGGEAKNTIQNNKVLLNNQIESRRAKKLFPGDVVSLASDTTTEFDVAFEVSKRGYLYKVKSKKVKPVAQIDAYGNKEFGGRFRSDEWRAERREKKEERKMMNKRQVLKDEEYH